MLALVVYTKLLYKFLCKELEYHLRRIQKYRAKYFWQERGKFAEILAILQQVSAGLTGRAKYMARLSHLSKRSATILSDSCCVQKRNL